jgi:hypothetical protein
VISRRCVWARCRYHGAQKTNQLKRKTWMVMGGGEEGGIKKMVDTSRAQPYDAGLTLVQAPLLRAARPLSEAPPRARGLATLALRKLNRQPSWCVVGLSRLRAKLSVLEGEVQPATLLQRYLHVSHTHRGKRAVFCVGNHPTGERVKPCSVPIYRAGLWCLPVCL